MLHIQHRVLKVQSVQRRFSFGICVALSLWFLITLEITIFVCIHLTRGLRLRVVTLSICRLPWWEGRGIYWWVMIYWSSYKPWRVNENILWTSCTKSWRVSGNILWTDWTLRTLCWICHITGPQDEKSDLHKIYLQPSAKVEIPLSHHIWYGANIRANLINNLKHVYSLFENYFNWCKDWGIKLHLV